MLLRNGKLRPYSNLDFVQSDKQVTVKDLTGKEKDRLFTYDHAMWSFDGFNTEANGYFSP